MPRVEKTVFISYRRTNFWTALAIYQHLTSNGFDVFMDYRGIAAGDFESQILENVRARAHFLILLTPSALERLAEPGDWLRREIETAIESRRNIVPLLFEGFDFGSPMVAKQLSGALSALPRYQGSGGACRVLRRGDGEAANQASEHRARSGTASAFCGCPARSGDTAGGRATGAGSASRPR